MPPPENCTQLRAVRLPIRELRKVDQARGELAKREKFLNGALGVALRRLRSYAGVKQCDMAAAIGCNLSRLNQMEAGRVLWPARIREAYVAECENNLRPRSAQN